MKFLKYVLLATLVATATQAASEELEVPREEHAQSAWAFFKDRLLQDVEMRRFTNTASRQLSILDQFSDSTPNAQQKLTQLLAVVKARAEILHETYLLLHSKNYSVLYLAKDHLEVLHSAHVLLDEETSALLAALDEWSEDQCNTSFAPTENLLNKYALAFDTLSECLNVIVASPEKMVARAKAKLAIGYTLPETFFDGLFDILCATMQSTIFTGQLSRDNLIASLRTILHQVFHRFSPEENDFGIASFKELLRPCLTAYCSTQPASKEHTNLPYILMQEFDAYLKEFREKRAEGLTLVISLAQQSKYEADQLAKQTFAIKKYIFFTNELLQKLSDICNTRAEAVLTLELLPHIFETLSAEEKEATKLYAKNYIEYIFILIHIENIFQSLVGLFTEQDERENALIIDENMHKLSQMLLLKRNEILTTIRKNHDTFIAFLNQELAEAFNRITELANQCSDSPVNVHRLFESFNRRSNNISIAQTIFAEKTIYRYIKENNIYHYLAPAALPFGESMTYLLHLFSGQEKLEYTYKNIYGNIVDKLLKKFSVNTNQKKRRLKKETLGKNIVASARTFLRKYESSQKARSGKKVRRRGNGKSKGKQNKNKKNEKQRDTIILKKNEDNAEKSVAADTRFQSEIQTATDTKTASHTPRTAKQKRVWKQLLGCFEPTIRIIDQTENTVIARCWRSFDSRDNVLILMRRCPGAQLATHDDCAITVDPARLPKMVDTLDRGWDMFHTIPLELLEQFLPILGAKHSATNEYLSQLGFDLRENTHALTIEAKLLRGYMANPKADEFDALWAKPYGHIGAFIWGVHNDDKSVFHRFFHSPALLSFQPYISS